jgi:hypothetical protein
MLKKFAGLLLAAPLMLASLSALAQEERSYTEGNVLEISAIKIKAGGFDAYMSWLQKTWKAEQEEYKKAGLIVDYGVYATNARNPNEPDLYLTVVYKNWGALDGLQAKTDPIDKKIFGSLAQANQGFVDREKIREVLGVEYIQELKLK